MPGNRKEKIMRARTTIAAVAAMLLASVSTVCLGDITYNVVDYGQDGVTIGGTITTDGNYGVLGTGDITSFNVTITPPSESSFTLTPSSTEFVLCNYLCADSSSLYLPPGLGDYFHLWSTNTGPVVILDYEDYYSNPLSASADGLYVHDFSNTQLFYIGADTGLIGYDPMIIATVATPVPGSLMLAAIGMGIAGLGGYLRRRRVVS
jgi:hypothetical protein